MQYEKFEADGKSGVRFLNVTFASSKSRNGCHFDPVDVFKSVNAPEKFDKNHSETEFLETKWTNINEPVWDKEKEIFRFTGDIESTDPYVVEHAEEFSGPSPLLVPKKKPAHRGNAKAERFYGPGDLQWQRTALLFNTTPGFVGAEDFELEKFSAQEDVLIEETFQDDSEGQQGGDTQTKPTEHEPTPPNPESKKEEFSFWSGVGSYAKTSDGRIGKVTKIEQLENKKSNYNLTLLDGTQMIVSLSGDWETDRNMLNEVSVSDVLDYLVNKSADEGFNADNQTPPAKEKSAEELQKEKEDAEKFERNMNRAKAMGKAATEEKFSKQGAVEDNGSDDQTKANAISSLKKKLFK